MLFGLLCATGQAQQLQFNAPSPLPHGAFGDIHSSPGSLGDRYYLLYNEMQRKIKGERDPGDSYLQVYDVSHGKLMRSVNLDSLVAGGLPGNNILFTDVLIWKGSLLGVFAAWMPMGNHVRLYAQRFDQEGRRSGVPMLLETASAATAGEKGPGTDAKDVLAFTADLRYGFNRDSSRFVLYYGGNTWKGCMPVTLTPGLGALLTWRMPAPAGSRIAGCVPGRQDSLFALVCQKPGPGKTGTLFRMYGAAGGVPYVSIPVELPGKAIQDAAIGLDREDHPVATGTYALDTTGKQVNATYGVFALRFNTAGRLLASHIRPFQGAMISDLENYHAAAKDKGLEGIVRISKIIPLPGAGMVSVGRSVYQGAEVTASPVILTPHYDAGGNTVLTGIDPSGEITWISYMKRYYEDYPSTSMPVPFYATRDKQSRLVVVYDENGEQRTHQQIYVDRYDQTGIQDRDWVALPRSFNTRSTWILWNTACTVGQDAIMVAYYNTWKKELGTLKIGLPYQVRVTANP